MRFTTISYAYPHVEGAIRADLTRRWRRDQEPEDCWILSTCLRLEVTVTGDEDDLHRALTSLFGKAGEVAVGKVRSGKDAVLHLFRVAAGLESPILGEQEILTQFRQTVARAEDRELVSGMFSKLLETAVAVGRRARDLLPESPHDSLGAVAAQVVGSAGRVAVLGSGAMSTAVVAGLRGLPAPPQVVVVARRPERVTIDDVEIWPFDRAAEAVRTFPAVVSATSAKRRLLPDGDLSRALAQRDTPLQLVDMAMPPDFPQVDRAVVRYLEIDDLARMAERRTRSSEVDEFVRSAAEEAHRRFVNHHEVGPMIGELMKLADDIVDRTVERFAGRLGDPEDVAVLRQTAHTVARTLLSGPVEYAQQVDRAPEAIDIVAEAFDLDDV